MNVVLDKSYLQGSSVSKIRQMCSEHRLIMTEVLFLEILTTKTENMVKCFKKLPEIENPVALVPSVGSLIRYEVENDKQCSPIETQFLKIRYEFNKHLVKNQFVFTKKQIDDLEKWKELTTYNTLGFIEKAIVTDNWLPVLKGYKPGDSPDPISDAMKIVATEYDFIIQIYDQLRDGIYKKHKALWPEPSKIGKQWILFRYLQVHLLATIEYIKNYGKESQAVITKRLENDYLDIEYCIIGAIADGLATRDKTMAKFHKLLCPNQALFS